MCVCVFTHVCLIQNVLQFVVRYRKREGANSKTREKKLISHSKPLSVFLVQSSKEDKSTAKLVLRRSDPFLYYYSRGAVSKLLPTPSTPHVVTSSLFSSKYVVQSIQIELKLMAYLISSIILFSRLFDRNHLVMFSRSFLLHLLASPSKVVVDNVKFLINRPEDKALVEHTGVLLVVNDTSRGGNDEDVGVLVSGQRLRVQVLNSVSRGREVLEVHSYLALRR